MQRSMSDNLHSRLVVWAKVTLPLLALMLLSTLFLVSRRIDPSDAIPYAEVDVEERAREPRLTQPTFAGVTSDGAALTISADEARPDAVSGATASRIVGNLQTPDGARTDMVAGSARIDDAAGQMVLENGVEITTSTGYLIWTEALTTSTDRTSLSSPGEVTAQGPVGQIDAASMTLRQDPAKPGSYLLVFSGRVSMLYSPKK